MQWTSRFFEVVIVASCDEYLSLPKKKLKKRIPQLQLLLTAGGQLAFQSGQGYSRAAHSRPCCMSWQPNLWPVTSFFFLFFFLGGRADHYTYNDMQRKKPQVSNGRPSTAEAASYPQYLGRGRHKSLQRGNMSGKTSSPQGSCPPAHSQACSFSTNKASPLSESTQHSCQDHNLKST